MDGDGSSPLPAKRKRKIELRTVRSICFINTNNVNVDTLVHCFLSGKGAMTNCSHASDRLARHLVARKTRVRCRRSVSLVPRRYGSGTDALIICAPTIPRKRTRLACFHRGNFSVRGHSRMLNVVAHDDGNLYITNARNGAAADAVTTRLLRRSRINYVTFLKNVSGGCNAGLLLSTADPCAIVRTSRFSHSFR